MHGNYIIADTHFHHSNVIKYTKRPFRDVEHMDYILRKNWNNKVKKTDTVYFLGDFAFAKKKELKKLLKGLNGRKVLIMGNHDRRINKKVKFWYDVGFYEVYKYPIIYKDILIMSHEPQKDIGRFYNAHGHIHDELIDDERYINVSVEHHNHTPTNLDKIMARVAKKIEKRTCIKSEVSCERESS